MPSLGQPSPLPPCATSKLHCVHSELCPNDIPPGQQLELVFAAARPIVKWAGGKSRVLPQLRSLLPVDFELRRYHEPFAGGAALFFALNPHHATLSDINAQLVATYRCVVDAVEALIAQLRELERLHSTEHYYVVRSRYNATGDQVQCVQRAADFIYLNKACFNGLYRVNKAGHFNVPAGRYRAPRILDAAGLRAASSALRAVTLRHAPFEEVLERVRPGDFVYLDPPYDVETGESNFTSYAASFGPREQDAVAAVFRELDARGCCVMLSNSDTRANRQRYLGYDVREIQAPRAIGCSATSRGVVTELVVRNYG